MDGQAAVMRTRGVVILQFGGAGGVDFNESRRFQTNVGRISHGE